MSKPWESPGFSRGGAVKGSKTITAKARNPWGESAATPPFTFTAGTPAAPTGIGLSVQ